MDSTRFYANHQRTGTDPQQTGQSAAPDVLGSTGASPLLQMIDLLLIKI